MKNILRYIGIVITTLVVAIAVFIGGAFAPKVLPVDEWFGGWYTFRVVVSGSMTPTIPVGSVVVTWPTENYGVGDVITFHSQDFHGMPTTHRIVEVKTVNGHEAYITKGDANEDPDYGATPKSEVLGEVFLHVPYAGYISHFVKGHKWPVAVALLFILVFWLGIDYLRK